MSELIVLTFGDEQGAARMRQELRALQEQGLVKIEDLSEVRRDQKGKARVVHEESGIVG